MMNAADWRTVIAALANADLQPVVGRMLLGDTVSEALAGLRGERIEQYPANPSERRELLAWVAERVLTPGETVDEATINTRLERFSNDTAMLRRYLVDHSLLERRQDGSVYSRPLVADDVKET